VEGEGEEGSGVCCDGCKLKDEALRRFLPQEFVCALSNKFDVEVVNSL
jgi:hypothetical protein